MPSLWAYPSPGHVTSSVQRGLGFEDPTHSSQEGTFVQRSNCIVAQGFLTECLTYIIECHLSGIAYPPKHEIQQLLLILLEILIFIRTFNVYVLRCGNKF